MTSTMCRCCGARSYAPRGPVFSAAEFAELHRLIVGVQRCFTSLSSPIW